jgi:hypothetical protein
MRLVPSCPVPFRPQPQGFLRISRSRSGGLSRLILGRAKASGANLGAIAERSWAVLRRGEGKIVELYLCYRRLSYQGGLEIRSRPSCAIRSSTQTCCFSTP